MENKKELLKTVSGIKIKDYHDIGINGLEEIIALNQQEIKQIQAIYLDITDCLDICMALSRMRNLLHDINDHTDYCQKCIDEILSDMERSTAKEENNEV